MQDTINNVRKLNDRTLIKKILKHLIENQLINERVFNTLSRENGFRTRFHGFGLIINHIYKKYINYEINSFIKWFLTFNFINI